MQGKSDPARIERGGMFCESGCRVSEAQEREKDMSAAGAERRKMTSADELFDEARRLAADSADPEATYEGFLRGLEMGLSAGTLSPVLSKAIGNRLADLRTDDRESTTSSPARERHIADPRRPMIRKAPERLLLSDIDFPTEWTLEP